MTEFINNFILIYLIIINLISFVIYGVDKNKAKKRLWRIPEATLLGLALIGGSVGAYIGMKSFHHKTKHIKFYLGVPIIFLLQVIVYVITYWL